MSSFRQVYLGRVIAPAKFFEGSGKKPPYITFVLAVNGGAMEKKNDKYERTSAKITCSYTVKTDDDMVALALSRITTDNNPQELGGESYKSVAVIVEGTERLVASTDDKGNFKGYFKNLDFCSVSIVDDKVRNLYHAEMKQNGQEEEKEETKVQPTLAPATKKVAPKVEEPVEAADEYEVGQVVKDPSGQEFKFLGGDASDLSCWEKVVPAPVAPAKKKVPPFMSPKKAIATAVTKAPAKEEPSVSQMLEDDGEVENHNLFDAITKGKGLAV